MGGGSSGKRSRCPHGGIGRDSSNAEALASLSPNSSSSSSSNYIIPLLATSAHSLNLSPRNDLERHRLNCGSSLDSAFGSVPNQPEVEYAIAAFQSFMQGLTSSRSTSDRLQHLWSHYYQRISHSPGFVWVYDAFQMLQTLPSVHRMVASISTDRAVWEAVLNNQQVQEFRRSVKQAEISRPQVSNEEQYLISMILSWIVDNLKLKVAELIETLKSLVNSSINSPKKEISNPELKHQFEEIIASTVLLSTITLMIVLVTRIYRMISFYHNL